MPGIVFSNISIFLPKLYSLCKKTFLSSPLNPFLQPLSKKKIQPLHFLSSPTQIKIRFHKM